MQRLVGIVRQENEMQQALAIVEKLCARAEAAAVHGHREYNPGWHTALDLRHLLTVSEAIARCAIERKESRGGHFREDYPEKVAGVRRRSTWSFARRPTARWSSAAFRFRRCRRTEAGHRGQQVSSSRGRL